MILFTINDALTNIHT